MVVEKRVLTYVGACEARAVKTWHDANERCPGQQPFSGLADDGAPAFVEMREMSWHQTSSHGS
jgi:hypothetical protein